jgi:hypothetical protein
MPFEIENNCWFPDPVSEKRTGLSELGEFNLNREHRNQAHIFFTAIAVFLFRNIG